MTSLGELTKILVDLLAHGTNPDKPVIIKGIKSDLILTGKISIDTDRVNLYAEETNNLKLPPKTNYIPCIATQFAELMEEDDDSRHNN